MTDSNERPETWKPVAPMDGCTFSGYEASDKGRYRSVDRLVGNRQLKGKVLATRRNDDGYVLVNIRCDNPDHKGAHTFSGHKITLTTFAGPCPPGMEACHSDRGKDFNWWPEGIRWDTKAGNHADMAAAGTAVIPESFPCRNHDRCGGTVRNPGRRCASCVAEVGRDAADMLRAGRSLQEVAEAFGYTTVDWVYRLAVEHGYTGTKAEARAQGALAVHHGPCRCLDCAPGTQRERGWFTRALTTLRARRRGDAQ